MWNWWTYCYHYGLLAMEIGVILTHIVKMTSIDEVSLEFVILFKFQLNRWNVTISSLSQEHCSPTVWQSVYFITFCKNRLVYNLLPCFLSLLSIYLSTKLSTYLKISTSRPYLRQWSVSFVGSYYPERALVGIGSFVYLRNFNRKLVKWW